MYLESASVDSPFPQRLVRPTTAESLGCTADQKPNAPAAGYLDGGGREGIRPFILLCALCPALHGHGRRIGALSHRSRTLLSPPVGLQPRTALPAGTGEHKNPNQF